MIDSLHYRTCPVAEARTAFRQYQSPILVHFDKVYQSLDSQFLETDK
jgi:hypothetical protein